MKIIPLNYQNQPLHFTNDGWFNATEAAAKFGKQVYEWQRLPDTQAYLAGFERKYGKIPYLKTRRGNNGGTWLHPKLAVQFARWLDIDFAIWCDEQIDNLIRGEIKPENLHTLRHQCAASFKLMADVLHDTRQAELKDTERHHYINEALLVNEALTGKREALDRTALPIEQLDQLAALETLNARLILQGKPYPERKAALMTFAPGRARGIAA